MNDRFDQLEAKFDGLLDQLRKTSSSVTDTGTRLDRFVQVEYFPDTRSAG